MYPNMPHLICDVAFDATGSFVEDSTKWKYKMHDDVMVFFLNVSSDKQEQWRWWYAAIIRNENISLMYALNQIPHKRALGYTPCNS